MSALNPSDNDTSPRADLRRAIRRVERERVAGIFLFLGLAVGGALLQGVDFTTGAEMLLVAAVVALSFVFSALCGLRIDAYSRELRSLPPRF
jgi:hypothetical protein